MLLQQGAWTLRPRIDFGATYVSAGSFNESGGNALRVGMDGSSNTYFDVQPAIDFMTEFEASDGTLVRPILTLGVTQFLGDPTVTDRGRVLAAPGTVASFSGSTDLDRTRLNLAAGVDVFTREDVAVRAEFAGSFSEHSSGYGAALKFEMSF